MITTVYGDGVKLPSMRSRFCIQRATYNIDKASDNSFWDTFMLVTAGLTAGTGATLGASTAAMDDGSTKKDLQIVGAGTLAAGGAILAVRTTLALNELARTQRIAAANEIDAAIDILEKYALADDPKDVGADGFDNCRDEEVNVARAYPGARSGEAIQRLVETAKEKEEEAKTRLQDAAADVAAATDEGAAATAELQAAGEMLKSTKPEEQPRLQVRQAAAAARAELAKRRAEVARSQLEEAQKAAKEADVEARRAAFLQATYSLRRAIFYGTQADVDYSTTLVKQAAIDLDTARGGSAKEEPPPTSP
jgi:hypothetical protein